METDAFSQSATDDPFAGSDFGDFDQAEPVRPPQEAEIPVVDREGNRVEEAPPAPQPEVAPEAPEPSHVPADGASEESQEGEAATPPQEPEVPAQQPVERTERTEVEPQRAAERAPEAPSIDPAAQAALDALKTETPPAANAGQPPIAEQPAQPDPEAAGEKASVALQPDDSQTGTAEGEAEPPKEKKDKNGRVTHRKYVILKVTGTDKFERMHWHEDKDGNLAPRGQSGTKRQGVLLARSTEDALKFGYAAIGAPQDGATLVAIAELYFQPKRIKPKPPEPLRQRLEIS